MSRGNPGVSKLLNSMKKLIREVNDKEICNRLEILMGVEKEDIPPQLARALFEDPLSFDADQIPEPFSQYVKHYLYMVKRDQRIQNRERQEKESRKAGRPAARTTRQGSVKKESATKETAKKESVNKGAARGASAKEGSAKKASRKKTTSRTTQTAKARATKA